MKTGTIVVLFTLFNILTLVSESNCLVLSLPPEGKVCEMSLTECVSKICILKIFFCKVVYTKAKIISSIIFHNFIIFELLLTHIFPFSRFFCYFSYYDEDRSHCFSLLTLFVNLTLVAETNCLVPSLPNKKNKQRNKQTKNKNKWKERFVKCPSHARRGEM